MSQNEVCYILRDSTVYHAILECPSLRGSASTAVPYYRIHQQDKTPCKICYRKSSIDKIVLTQSTATLTRNRQGIIQTVVANVPKLNALVASDFLPPGTRWVSFDRSTVVIEVPPRIMRARTSREDHYHIPTPWTVYVIGRSSRRIAVLARTSPLTSLDDEVCYYHMPNVTSNGWACYSPPYGSPSDTLQTAATAWMNGFWEATFNNDFYYYDRFKMTVELWAAVEGGSFDVDRYFKKLEKMTLEQLCAMEWKPIGPLRDFLFFGATYYEQLENWICRHPDSGNTGT